MAHREVRSIMCYRCGMVLGQREVELTRAGIEHFRREAERVREEHSARCGRKRQTA